MNRDLSTIIGLVAIMCAFVYLYSPIWVGFLVEGATYDRDGYTLVGLFVGGLALVFLDQKTISCKIKKMFSWIINR